MLKLRATNLIYSLVILGLITVLASSSAQALPPLCPHVLGWGGGVYEWANGAPWIKVLFPSDVTTAKSRGAKVLYRPYSTALGTDDGDLPTSISGTQYADAVWATISGLAQKPDAIGYRNEFAWNGTAANRHTSAQFISYRDRLRALGYTGWVVYGSYPVGWPESSVWDEPEVKAAASYADAVETHEYFDFTVTCLSPYLTFRHRDLAINAHPSFLGNKPWFIGEFGSDQVCGPTRTCGDPQCRQGWLDRGKLTASAYVTQMSAYRANCHPNVVAIFVFQQGSGGWANFETINSPEVSNYMKSTWAEGTYGTISGTVKDVNGNGITGASVSLTPGNYTGTSQSGGSYSISNVLPGTYSVTATKSGYEGQTQTGKMVTVGATTTVNFTLQNGIMYDCTPTGINYARNAVEIQTDSNYTSSYDGPKAVDGVITAASKWCSANTAAPHWLTLDLGADRSINGYIVRHAGAAGESASYNVKNFSIQTASSMNGPWTNEVTIDNSSQSNITSRCYYEPKVLRYVRLYIATTGTDNYARIPEFEVLGTDTTPPVITGISANPAFMRGEGTTTISANVTDNYAISSGGIYLPVMRNRLANPSFEEGMDGWTDSSGMYSINSTYPSPGTAKNGSSWVGASCATASGIKSPELRQLAGVVAGSKYFISVWVNTGGSPNPCSAYLQWKDGTATGDGQCTTLASTTSNTSGWKQLYGIVTPTTSILTFCLKLSWDCGSSGGGGNFDMAQVSIAPNPNSYTGGVATWNNVAVYDSYAFSVCAKDDAGNITLATSPTNTVTMDWTAPGTPVVTDDGKYAADTGQLHGSWSSADPESGIAEYQYSIGTSAGDTSVLGWTSAGTASSISKTGLSLAYNSTYHINVKARNGVGDWSAVGSSDGITIARSASTIADAKGYADGTAVQLSDKVVSFKADSVFWIEEPDRSSGIMVKTEPVFDLGAKLIVAGKLLTEDGERSLDAAEARQIGSAELIEPVSLKNESLGGYSLNAYTPGVLNGHGANNIGLLAAVWGRVTPGRGADYIYIDDGSGIKDGTFSGVIENIGVRVICNPSLYSTGDYLLVTGISSSFKTQPGDIVRRIVTSGTGDILKVPSP